MVRNVILILAVVACIGLTDVKQINEIKMEIILTFIRNAIMELYQ